MDFSSMDEGHADGEEPVHYYYNREERLSRAPKIVQDYYNGKGPRPVKGIFKLMVSTPANRIGLISLAVFAVFVLIYSFTGEKPYRKTVSGTEMTLSAFSYEDKVYVSLKAGAKKKNTEKDARRKPEMLTVLFSAVDNQKETVSHAEEKDMYSGEELTVRTKFSDYDIVSVKADVAFNGENKTLTAPVEKK